MIRRNSPQLCRQRSPTRRAKLVRMNFELITERLCLCQDTPALLNCKSFALAENITETCQSHERGQHLINNQIDILCAAIPILWRYHVRTQKSRHYAHLVMRINGTLFKRIEIVDDAQARFLCNLI